MRIFTKKDLARGEHEAYLCYTILHQKRDAGDRDSQEHEHMGASAAWLPLARAELCRAQEGAHRQGKTPNEVEDFIKLLPGEAEGYNDEFKALFQLMLPLDQRFEPLKPDPEVFKMRHQLRRESLDATRPNPFDFKDCPSPHELWMKLPSCIREFVESVPSLEKEQDVSVRVTRAVVLWSDWVSEQVAREQHKADSNGKSPKREHLQTWSWGEAWEQDMNHVERWTASRGDWAFVKRARFPKRIKQAEEDEHASKTGNDRASEHDRESRACE